jgi:imidazolonepropionase-like amidohydrolase
MTRPWLSTMEKLQRWVPRPLSQSRREPVCLDESGKTLLLGLIGMHEHLFYISAGGGPGHLLLGTEQAESAPRLYLAAGITTARTTGAIEPATDLALKRAIEQGTQAGPDLDVTGPYLDGRPNAILQNQSLAGPDDARETVDYWSKRDVVQSVYLHHACRAEGGD